MELSQIIVAGLAISIWLWLANIARRDLSLMILLQQRMGMSTPRSFYEIRDCGNWLVLGAVFVVASYFIPEAFAAVSVVMLIIGLLLLAHIHLKERRFLHPRVIHSVLNRLERGGNGPEDPAAA